MNLCPLINVELKKKTWCSPFPHSLGIWYFVFIHWFEHCVLECADSYTVPHCTGAADTVKHKSGKVFALKSFQSCGGQRCISKQMIFSGSKGSKEPWRNKGTEWGALQGQQLQECASFCKEAALSMQARAFLWERRHSWEPLIQRKAAAVVLCLHWREGDREAGDEAGEKWTSKDMVRTMWMMKSQNRKARSWVMAEGSHRLPAKKTHLVPPHEWKANAGC